MSLYCSKRNLPLICCYLDRTFSGSVPLMKMLHMESNLKLWTLMSRAVVRHKMYYTVSAHIHTPSLSLFSWVLCYHLPSRSWWSSPRQPPSFRVGSPDPRGLWLYPGSWPQGVPSPHETEQGNGGGHGRDWKSGVPEVQGTLLQCIPHIKKV